MATMQEILDYYPHASAGWQADIQQQLRAASAADNMDYLGWLQTALTNQRAIDTANANKPPSTSEQIATGFAAPLLSGLGAGGGMWLGQHAFTGGAGAAGSAAGAGTTAAETAQTAAALAPVGDMTLVPGIAGTAPAAVEAGATGATGAGAGTGAAAGTGATAESPGLMGLGLGPAAAIAAGLYTGGRGLNSSLRQWNEGHGQQQSGVMNLANPLLGGVNSIAGHPFSNEDTGYVALATNPLTAPVGLPLAGYHYIGHNLLGLPDVPNFWGGKSQDQLGRDQVKNRLREAGVVGQDLKFNLGDNTFDLQNPTNPEGRHYYDVNWDSPDAQNLAGGTAALAAALGLTNNKQHTDATGMLYNAISGGGDSNENLRTLLDQAGGHDALYTSVAEQRNAGKISKGDADAYFNALDQAAGVGAYAPGGKAYVDPKKKGLIGLGQAAK